MIVGIDGEGAGRSPHRYTLLAYSDECGKHSAHIQNAAGLGTAACLEFLLRMPRGAKAFGFYLGYDWTKILADLPDKRLYWLFRPELRVTPGEGSGFSEVRWRHYRLHYLAGMMRIRDRKRTLTVWDVGKFYQTPFCFGTCRDEGHEHTEKCFSGALPKWSIGTVEQWTRIAGMKAKRGSFDGTSDARDVREYCLEECRLLSTLVRELIEAHRAAKLPLKNFYGPGSTASVALGQMNIKNLRGQQPEEVKRLARHAFFGGRFEQAEMGTIPGPIFGYDIISAYPAATLDLPCLVHGRWRRVHSERALKRATHALVRFELAETRAQQQDRVGHRWGPLPIRLANGNIVFPHSGARGWAWLDEYRQAREGWNAVRFGGEAWVLSSRCECTPFARVHEWFEERKRIGKSGRGIVLKLALNSIYGKLAQAIGDPPFASRVWAGMITSATRAKLLEAIRLNEAAILATATDGIYSREALPLDVGDRLGQWEAKQHSSITLVRPGIYWTEDTVRARGLGRKTLSESQKAVLEGMARGEENIELPPIQQFGGAVACVYVTRDGHYRRAARYGEWWERPVRISLTAEPKRAPGFALWELPGVESVPYETGGLSLVAERLKRGAEMAFGMRG